MKLYIAEIGYDDGELDVQTYEVGVFDNEDLAYTEANKHRDWLINAFDAEERSDAFTVYLWETTLNESRAGWR